MSDFVEIELRGKARGTFVRVSPEDEALVRRYRWYIHAGRYAKGYRIGVPTRSQDAVLMHRLIMQPPDDEVVDHEDGDGLNNVRSNLRIATRSQNMSNTKIRSDNSCGYKGVGQNPQSGLWLAEIQSEGQRYHCGMYSTREEAALAYDAAARYLHGEFASTNLPGTTAMHPDDLQRESWKERGFTSPFRGVYWYPKSGRWKVTMKINGKSKYVGTFDCEIEAARAYDREVLERGLNRVINDV